MPAFVIVVIMVSEKMPIFHLFKIFYQLLWPWTRMNVLETGMSWKASPQSSFMPGFGVVVVMMSEKLSCVGFSAISVSVTFSEGHSKCCYLKGLVETHHWDKFHVCNGHSDWTVQSLNFCLTRIAITRTLRHNNFCSLCGPTCSTVYKRVCIA